jgi:hypothetical protein
MKNSLYESCRERNEIHITFYVGYTLSFESYSFEAGKQSGEFEPVLITICTLTDVLFSTG